MRPFVITALRTITLTLFLWLVRGVFVVWIAPEVWATVPISIWVGLPLFAVVFVCSLKRKLWIVTSLFAVSFSCLFLAGYASPSSVLWMWLWAGFVLTIIPTGVLACVWALESRRENELKRMNTGK